MTIDNRKVDELLAAINERAMREDGMQYGLPLGEYDVKDFRRIVQEWLLSLLLGSAK